MGAAISKLRQYLIESQKLCDLLAGTYNYGGASAATVRSSKLRFAIDICESY